MACEEIQTKLDSLNVLKTQTNQQLQSLGTHATPTERADLLHQIQQINAQIASTKISLTACLKAAATPPPVAAPKSILEIQFTNPSPGVDTSDPKWADKIAGGTFPLHSDLEWKQVLAPTEDYDLDAVGASGWVVNPSLASTDFPFLHPFGGDWEFGLAPDPQYAPLLAPGNSAANGADTQGISDAAKFQIPIPSGLLGVEMDGSHVPSSFQQNVHVGDRMAVFGRWIVDCGHDPFRTEIHPPLLMACASPQRDSTGAAVTRVVFTSRPYLVGQKFTVDTNDISNDQAADDGGFFPHIVSEVIKVDTLRSLLVEAHPKIKSHPFLGVHLAHFVIRPPAPARQITTGLNRRLSVSFHFTVRSGCAVQVMSTTTGAVDVLVALNNVGYIPPPLPKRNGRRYSREELAAADADAGTGYLAVEVISAAAQAIFGFGGLGAVAVTGIFSRGIETDVYDPLPAVNVLDTQHAAANVFADSVPANVGVTHDDSQPFPFFGWLEAKWVQSTPVLSQ